MRLPFRVYLYGWRCPQWLAQTTGGKFLFGGWITVVWKRGGYWHVMPIGGRYGMYGRDVVGVISNVYMHTQFLSHQ